MLSTTFYHEEHDDDDDAADDDDAYDDDADDDADDADDMDLAICSLIWESGWNFYVMRVKGGQCTGHSVTDQYNV